MLNGLDCFMPSSLKLYDDSACVKNYDPKELPKEIGKVVLFGVATVCSIVAAAALVKLASLAFIALCPMIATWSTLTFLGAVGPLNVFFLLPVYGPVALLFFSIQNVIRLRSCIPANECLENLSVRDIEQILEQKGINWYSIPGVAQEPNRLLALKPVIAQLNKWEAKVQKYETLHQQHTEKITLLHDHYLENIVPNNPRLKKACETDIRRIALNQEWPYFCGEKYGCYDLIPSYLYKERRKLMDIRKSLFNAKIEAARFHAWISKPNQPNTNVMRFIYKQANFISTERSAVVIFDKTIFRSTPSAYYAHERVNPNVRPDLTWQFVQSLSIAQLSQYFLSCQTHNS
ncbi:MAG: hypothetical protein V4492_02370 [Chlamydiota bacterium]